MGTRGVRGVWELFGVIWGVGMAPPKGILTNKTHCGWWVERGSGSL